MTCECLIYRRIKHKSGKTGKRQHFSFLDIVIPENKTAFQEYTKYLFRITAQSVSTIKIQHAYTREFLHFWKKKLWLYRI